MTKYGKRILLFLSFGVLIFLVFSLYKYRFKMYYRFLGGNPVIVMVGSTLTFNGHWDILLSRQDVINSGSLNATTAQILSESQEKILKFKPKICFIEGGTNDLLNGVSITQIQHNTRLLVSRLKSDSVLPVIELSIYTASDTTFNKRTDSLNTALVSVAEQTGAEYIDLNPVLSVNGFLQKKYAKQPLLLTRDAYPQWATLVKKVLNKYSLK